MASPAWAVSDLASSRMRGSMEAAVSYTIISTPLTPADVRMGRASPD
jgi:hypothetical protein